MTALAVLVAAGCAPPTTPPPTLPPGVIDITDAPTFRWEMGEPVDLQLGALGVGNSVGYELESGTLPSGVQLSASGRLAGVPEFSGTWFAAVHATGSTGSKSAQMFGYVVEEGPVGPAPTLTDNPLRAPFIFHMPGNEGAAPTYPLYRPGSVTPVGSSVYSGSAAYPPDPAFQPQSEWAIQQLVRSQRRLEIALESSDCRASLSSIFGEQLRTIVLDPNEPCYNTNQSTSRDGSTILVSSWTSSGTGSWDRRFWFVRSDDGEVLRAATATVSAESPSLILNAEGTLVAVADAPNKIQVVGVEPEDDKTISLEDGSDRTCQARGTQIGGFSPTTGADRVLLSCETHGESFQTGTAHLRSGEVWLSAPIAKTNPETGRDVAVYPLALSPSGEQIVVLWGEYEFISFWPPETRYFLKWGVIDVGGTEPGIRHMLDDPPDTLGLFMFLEE